MTRQISEREELLPSPVMQSGHSTYICYGMSADKYYMQCKFEIVLQVTSTNDRDHITFSVLNRQPTYLSASPLLVLDIYMYIY